MQNSENSSLETFGSPMKPSSRSSVMVVNWRFANLATRLRCASAALIMHLIPRVAARRLHLSADPRILRLGRVVVPSRMTIVRALESVKMHSSVPEQGFIRMWTLAKCTITARVKIPSRTATTARMDTSTTPEPTTARERCSPAPEVSYAIPTTEEYLFPILGINRIMCFVSTITTTGQPSTRERKSLHAAKIQRSTKTRPRVNSGAPGRGCS